MHNYQKAWTQPENYFCHRCQWSTIEYYYSEK